MSILTITTIPPWYPQWPFQAECLQFPKGRCKPYHSNIIPFWSRVVKSYLRSTASSMRLRFSGMFQCCPHYSGYSPVPTRSIALIRPILSRKGSSITKKRFFRIMRRCIRCSGRPRKIVRGPRGEIFPPPKRFFSQDNPKESICPVSLCIIRMKPKKWKRFQCPLLMLVTSWDSRSRMSEYMLM